MWDPSLLLEGLPPTHFRQPLTLCHSPPQLPPHITYRLLWDAVCLFAVLIVTWCVVIMMCVSRGVCARPSVSSPMCVCAPPTNVVICVNLLVECPRLCLPMFDRLFSYAPSLRLRLEIYPPVSFFLPPKRSPKFMLSPAAANTHIKLSQR